MNSEYYIEHNGTKEGPLDLLTIMRRVRSGKIKPDTEIYINDAEISKRADSIDEISSFFVRLLEGPQHARALPGTPSMAELLRSGWSFTLEHNILTVYAGGMLLLLLMLTLALIGKVGVPAGLFISWCLFMVMHNLYFIFALRFFRGQPLGDDFINIQLAPVLLPIFLCSIMQAVIISAGITMLIIPGIIAATFFIFTPMILLDKHCTITEAFTLSYRMIRKAGTKHTGILFLLLALHLLCFALIMPVPLSLPIIMAAIFETYEKLST